MHDVPWIRLNSIRSGHTNTSYSKRDWNAKNYVTGWSAWLYDTDIDTWHIHVPILMLPNGIEVEASQFEIWHGNQKCTTNSNRWADYISRTCAKQQYASLVKSPSSMLIHGKKWRWGFYPKLCGKMSRWSAWQPLGGNCWMWVDRVTCRQTYANITCNQPTMKLGGGLVLFHLAWLRDLPKWSRPVWRLTCQAWITTCAIAIHLISRSCKRLSCSVEIWVRWRNCLMNIFWIRQIIQKTSSDLRAERSAVMLMVRLTLAISIAFSCRWLSWGHDTAHIWVRLTWAPLLFPRSPKSLSPWWCTWLEGLALPTHTTRSELQTEFR